ncbi:pseudouridine synthase, partial [Pisolithus microcarpus]
YAVYADRSIIVLNKPPGLICQGSLTNGRKPRDADKFNDLLHDLKDHFNLGKLPYAVHRLDKSTTGALVLVKNIATARQLARQFQSRTVVKTYLALVRGGEKSFPTRSGEIKDAIEINSDGRVSIGEHCDAEFAATDWEWVASSPKVPLSLLRLTLHTGLKHQLRVHLAHSLQSMSLPPLPDASILPFLGDALYSRKPISEKVTQVIRVPEHRVFLHASRLTLLGEFSRLRFKKAGPSKHIRLGIAAALPADFLDPMTISGGLFVDDKPLGGYDIEELQGKWLRPRRSTNGWT